ncbi:hypothetical protein THAOC_05660 [Thalassiosira oceanica]|uniref:Uncharacterized protein n=1 Tax=Thalassiosira oceanica TaxID=159749 RepID=K0T6U4_THAOC|nr:hypothetical protein THAOC_05660 [Thalassiosira oceanica]|eukprot:EJK72774.1 hypothetical protein THAOC_05660 [Thalassiosira oceanica]
MISYHGRQQREQAKSIPTSKNLARRGRVERRVPHLEAVRTRWWGAVEWLVKEANATATGTFISSLPPYGI